MKFTLEQFNIEKSNCLRAVPKIKFSIVTDTDTYIKYSIGSWYVDYDFYYDSYSSNKKEIKHSEGYVLSVSTLKQSFFEKLNYNFFSINENLKINTNKINKIEVIDDTLSEKVNPIYYFDSKRIITCLYVDDIFYSSFPYR